MNRARFVALGALVSFTLAFLAGCGTSAKFRMDFSVPSPVISPLPIRMATYYPPQIRTHIYEEKIENHGDFRIDMTGAHEVLFSTVFSSLFEQYVEVENFDQVPGDMHGIISPSVQEVQITLPQQTRSDYYEVWIRYQLQLWDRTGQLIHSWPLAAYGKANKNNYPTLSRASAAALHDATEFALRDAAASMSFYFAREPQVQSWIDSLAGTTS
ncbi:MAG: hypothetical protein OXG05_07765 [Gammaproteobacteria bacterium]|nr:hypothetical protein [Gammaproteobacteria bacterium]